MAGRAFGRYETMTLAESPMPNPRAFLLLVLLAAFPAAGGVCQTIVTSPEGRFGPARPTSAPSNPEAKAQAERLVSVLHMTKGLQASIRAEVARSRAKIDAESAALPPADRAKVLETFDQAQDAEAQSVLAAVTDWFAAYYARALTPSEMNDVLVFYEGDLGQKMIQASDTLTPEDRRTAGAYVLGHRAMSKAMAAMGEGAKAAAPYIRSERIGFSEDVAQAFCQDIKSLKLSARFKCVSVAAAEPGAHVIARPLWRDADPSDPAALRPFFPKSASRVGVSAGEVRVRCTADAAGALARCVVLDEAPEGLALGAHAVKALRSFRLASQDGDGVPVDGGVLILDLKFSAT